MGYELVTLKEVFTVKRICSVHYFEYTKDFDYSGESHDFWELVYIDKGEAVIRAEDNWTALLAGEIAFHKPNEFHTIRANGVVASNSIIVTFDCRSEYMKFFEGRILKAGDRERELLCAIVSEAKNAYSNDLGLVKFEKLKRVKNPPFGSEQLIKMSIESLLISLYRKDGLEKEGLTGSIKANSEKDNIDRVVEYIHQNLDMPLTFGEIAMYVKMSGTSLKNAFRQRMGMGVIEYLRSVKVESAKTLIREGRYNITQIAEKLGYSGPDKLSRQFKTVTGMSPTEYAKSVKASLETNNSRS